MSAPAHVEIDRTRLGRLLERERARFAEQHPRSRELYAESSQTLLGGVPMSWMTMWAGGFPLFMAEARGAAITDVEGHTFVDFCLGDTGAMAGHAPAATARADERQIRRGTTGMMPTEDAAWVGRELVRRFGLDAWQFALTATDANRWVLRMARTLTGRPKVLVFNGCYHGTVDESVIWLDDGVPRSRPGNVGPAVDPVETTKVIEFNDVDALRAALEPGDVAAVLAEPALTNIGIVLPEPGYLDAVREITRRHGVLLVVDETHTMCAGPGGCTADWGLEPDLLVVGKAIGGGIPCAAYGMTTEVADRLSGPMLGHDIDVAGVGGTLTGSALALAAIRATLSTALREEDFAVAVPLAERFTAGVTGAIEARGLPWHVQRLGCRAEYWFCPPPLDGAAAAAAVDEELEGFLHLWCLNRGVLLTPFHNMALFCPAHTEADVDRHTEVFSAAVDALAG